MGVTVYSLSCKAQDSGGELMYLGRPMIDCLIEIKGERMEDRPRPLMLCNCQACRMRDAQHTLLQKDLVLT